MRQSSKIQDMIKEEEYLKSRIKKENPFLVPDNYFQQFASNLMENLPERKSKSVIVQLRPLLYAAACVIAIFFVGLTFHFSQQNKEEKALMAVSAEGNYIDEAADYTMIDNVDIYSYLAEN